MKQLQARFLPVISGRSKIFCFLVFYGFETQTTITPDLVDTGRNKYRDLRRSLGLFQICRGKRFPVSPKCPSPELLQRLVDGADLALLFHHQTQRHKQSPICCESKNRFFFPSICHTWNIQVDIWLKGLMTSRLRGMIIAVKKKKTFEDVIIYLFHYFS